MAALVILALEAPSAHAAEGPDQLRERGLALLHEAMAGDDTMLIPAAESFARAARSYEQRGQSERAREARACLYWCRKRVPADLADEMATRLSEAQGKPDNEGPAPESAGVGFWKALEFARVNPDEHLLIAIHFFEVADRFRGTALSLRAQELSIEALQRVSLKAPRGDSQGTPPVKPEAGPAQTGEPDSAVSALQEAESRFVAETARARDVVIEELDRVVERFKERGNLDQLLRAREYREAFGEMQPPPELMRGALARKVTQYRRDAIHATTDLLLAYEGEMVSLSQDGRVEDVPKVRERMESFILKNACVDGRLLLLCDIRIVSNPRVQIATLAPGVERLSGKHRPPFESVSRQIVGAQFTRAPWYSTLTYTVRVTRSGYIYVLYVQRAALDEIIGLPRAKWIEVPNALNGPHARYKYRTWMTRGSVFTLHGFEACLIARSIARR